MTASQDRALAAEVEDAARAVPGVSGLFRAGAALSKAVDAGARLIGIRDDAPLVRVERTPQGLRVDVAIGVLGSAGAGETADRVHAAIDALLTRRHDGPAETRITVVHIEEASAPR